MRHFAYAALAAASLLAPAVLLAQSPGPVLPYEEGVERREAGLFFCDKQSIAAELAQLLNEGMLAQRRQVNGETLHVFGKDHPTMRLMSSRIANGECEVVQFESSVTPIALAYDGKFTDGLETVNGMNVIEALLTQSTETVTIYVLTDAAFVAKSG